MRHEGRLFVFDGRDDVIREILHGSHAHNLRGHECAACGRLRVHVRTPMLTPFSSPDHMRLPGRLAVDVDSDWQKWQFRGTSEDSPPTRPTCGGEMRALAAPVPE
jgi:hypothetical protein